MPEAADVGLATLQEGRDEAAVLGRADSGGQAATADHRLAYRRQV